MPDRSLRADARRNREAIVAAARAVFREHGLSAPLEAVASSAGVGTATLYRRFPTKVALVEEVFQDELRAYLTLVECGVAHPDPWQGFEDVVLGIARMQSRDRALADLVTLAPPGSGQPDFVAEGSRLIHRVVERAQAAGVLRRDFTAQDVVLLLMANAGVVRRTFVEAPGSWERVVRMVLDGLRTGSVRGELGPVPDEAAVWRSMSTL